MFRRLFRKQNEVETLLFSYIDEFKEIRHYFQEAMQATCDRCSQDTLAYLSGEVQRHESKADELLAQLVDLMFGHALLPDVRNRIMQLMYSMDRIPEIFKLILSTLRVQKLKIPTEIMGDFTILVDGVCSCCDYLADQFMAHLQKKDTVQQLLKTIRQTETHCDYQEEIALQRIFDKDTILPTEKIQLKEVIRLVGQIANLAEDISKGISILHISRSF